MDDLVTWLRAVLDEDEQLARATADLYMNASDGLLNIAALASPLREYLSDRTPVHSLADIAAKRAIVEWCVEVIGDRDLTNIDQFGSLHNDRQALAVTLANATLRHLAFAYSHRPGWQETWRPA